jgi:hypothetical protein
MRDFVTQSRSGIVTGGADVLGAAEALLNFYSAKHEGRVVLEQDRAVVEQFERRELTRRLAGVLDEVI